MRRHILITGGAGFIGCNVADRLAACGRNVLVLDNLSRPEVSRNIDWLQERHGSRVELTLADVRDEAAVYDAVLGADQVFHFAAQVAVTTSLLSPREDLDINVGGTLRVLEAIRACQRPPSLVFTSTNKVYGALGDVALEDHGPRVEPIDRELARHGVSEARPLDFHSPYGCSKGAADSYVLDYARTFGLPAVVFRMSCIYGPRQFGTEDQGWVAHFCRRLLRGEPITLYGDGRQVRDLLYIDDLVDALVLAQSNAHRLAGRAFNIGGGPDNIASLLEILAALEQATARRAEIAYDEPRTGDQRYYVSDTSRFRDATGWAPRVGLAQGLVRLLGWLGELERRPAVSELEAV